MASSQNSNIFKYKISQNENQILILQKGDITKWKGDAIVNAANQRMLGGGGVDGAIHRAAGPQLLKACEAVPEAAENIRCPTGEARITDGFNLPAKHVIHTVGPVYSQKNKEICEEKLYSAYQNSLKLANEYKLKTIAFPALSCGAFSYPIPEAAEVALRACQNEVGDMEEVYFVLFGDDTFVPFKKVADEKFEAVQQEQESS